MAFQLEHLIAQKNCSAAPANSAAASGAWRELMTNGVDFVPSTQTCFEGGVGFMPRVSARCAGAVCYDYPPPPKEVACDDGAPNNCWEQPCNVLLRKKCYPPCEKCGCGDKGNFYLFR